MTLHEAIKQVLEDNGRPMSAREIADEVNRRNLYQRGDGSPVPGSQIHARVKNYPALFQKNEAGQILLTSLKITKPKTDKPTRPISSSPKKPAQKLKLHEAIEQVLKDNGHPMSAREIADEINNKSLYQRGDGGPVPGSQIHARVKNYPALFQKNEARQILLTSQETAKTKTDIPTRSASPSSKKPVQKLKLHEAIEQVLKDKGRPMSAREIAEEINQKNLYQRKDGMPVPSSQINARVNNYPKLFLKTTGNKINLVAYSTSNFELFHKELSNKDSHVKPKKLNPPNLLSKEYSVELPPPSFYTGSDYVLSEDIISRYENEEVAVFRSKTEEAPEFDDQEKELRNFFNVTFNILRKYASFEDNTLFSSLLIFGAWLLSNEKSVQLSKKTLDHLKSAFYPDQVKNQGFVNNKLKKLLGFKNPQDEDPSNKVRTRLSELLSGVKEYFDDKGNITETILIHESLIKRIETPSVFTNTYGYIKSINDNKLFAEVFNAQLINELNSYGSKYHSHTNLLISELLVKIAGPIDKKTVFDPFAGIGRSVINMADSYNNAHFHLNEKNIYIYLLQLINLTINGIKHFESSNKDAFDTDFYKNRKADLIITDPPVLPKNDRFKSYTGLLNDIPVRDSVSDIVALLMTLTKSTGKVITIVPDSFLNNSRNPEFRKFLTEKNLLETVISLPFNSLAPVTSANMSLIVINFNKKDSFFRFINANKISFDYKKLDSSEYITDLRIIIHHLAGLYHGEYSSFDSLFNEQLLKNIEHANAGLTEIRNADYNLNASFYSNHADVLIKDMLQLGENIVKIKELLNDIKKEYYSSSKPIKLVKISDLSNKNELPYFNHKKVKTEAAEGKSIEVTDKPVIMLSTVGTSLKPTIFNTKHVKIIPDNKIAAYEINSERIHPEYMAANLNSDLTELQLEKIRTGSTVQSYRKSDLLNLMIPLPGLTEQLEWLAKHKTKSKQYIQSIEFLNEITLVENQHDLKREIERFAKKYFPLSEYITFKSPLEFESFPFSKEDIERGKYFKNSHDKKYKQLLIKQSNDKTLGVITIDEENDINYHTYLEINAYANFLYKTIEFITKSSTNESLARFAHTSKNLFSGLQGQLDSILSSKNKELIDALKTLFTDSEEFIQRKVEKGEKSTEDFVAFNRLKEIKEGISQAASFYLKTDKSFKNMANTVFSEFDIVAEVKSLTSYCQAQLKTNKESITVYAKKEPVKQSLIDILQNAKKYSSAGECTIVIESKENYTQITIANECSSVLPEDRYKKLGKQWLTNKNSNPGSGLYWAFQSIYDSRGEIELIDYNEHVEKKIFKVIIKLINKNY